MPNITARVPLPRDFHSFRGAVRAHLGAKLSGIELPAKVLLCLLWTRKLSFNSLQALLAPVRQEVAALLGAEPDGVLVEWTLEQSPGYQNRAVRIEIASLNRPKREIDGFNDFLKRQGYA